MGITIESKETNSVSYRFIRQKATQFFWQLKVYYRTHGGLNIMFRIHRILQ